jgi:hypothetical protein
VFGKALSEFSAPIRKGSDHSNNFASECRLVLDEFDRELERRGHRFGRYADDRKPAESFYQSALNESVR